MSEEHFQFSDGSSNKFWKIRLDGTSFTVNFGRIGTAGQVQTKEFKSEAEAEKEYNKLIAEKLKKGYERVAEGGQSNAPVPAAVAPKTAPAVKTASAGGSASPPVASSGVATLEPPTSAAASAPPMAAPAAEAEAVATPASAAPPAHAASAPAHAPASEPENAILFNAQDWLDAQFGVPAEPKQLSIQPFDRDQCIATLLTMNKGPEYWADDLRHRGADKIAAWSGEEAHFWLVALSNAQTFAYLKMDKFRRVAAFEGDDPQKLRTLLMRQSFRPSLPLVEAEQIVTGTRGRPEHFGWVPYALARLLTPEDYLRLWTDRLTRLGPQMYAGFERLIVPYLTVEQLSSLKDYLRRYLDSKDLTGLTITSDFEPALEVAALLGLKEQLLPIIEGFPDDCDKGGRCTSTVSLLLFGLNDSDLIAHHAQRMKLRMHTVRDLKIFIGKTGHAGTETAWSSVRRAYQDQQAMLQTALKLVSKQSAKQLLLHCAEEEDLRPAQSFLREYPLHSIEALAQLSRGNSNMATKARMMLRDMVGSIDVQSLSPALMSVLKELDCLPEQEDETAAASEPPAWLSDALNTVQMKKAKTPEWLQNTSLENIRYGGWRLTADQQQKLLAAMQQSSAEEMHPLILAIRQNGERRAADRFVWDLFNRWVAANGPPKDKWAMFSLGYIGSEKLIPQLLPMMYTWRESGHHQRAQVGLECLRIYGTDFALMQIHDISQSPKLKSLRARAIECMDEIAAARGMTKPELEDRIVPTCGLDAGGSREFDFGSRKFSFLFGPDLKPMVRDEKGAYKADLPGVTQKDDAELAKRSVEDWKELKKLLKSVAKVQAKRLEQSMVTCRAWTTDDFKTLLLAHPLMTNLIRRVVWGAYDNNNQLIKTFRVMEDKTLADESDRPIEIEDAARVRIVHPLNMTDEQKSKWGEIFTDYEITTLFPQIGRPIFGLQPEEENADAITRFAEIMLPSVAIPGTLERLGWWRGRAEDGGQYHCHYKHFYGDQITVFVEYEGIPMMMMQEWEDQSIDTCYFVEGIAKDDYYGKPKTMALKAVPPIVLSEVLYDLHTLTSNAKTDEED